MSRHTMRSGIPQKPDQCWTVFVSILQRAQIEPYVQTVLKAPEEEGCKIQFAYESTQPKSKRDYDVLVAVRGPADKIQAYAQKYIAQGIGVIHTEVLDTGNCTE